MKKYWWVYAMGLVVLLVNPWGYDVFELDKISLVRALGLVGFFVAMMQYRALWERFRSASWREPLLWFSIFILWSVIATIFSVSSVRSIMGSLVRGGGLFTMFAAFGWYLFIVTREIDRKELLKHLGIMSIGLIIGLSVLAQVQLYTKTFVFSDILLITTERPIWMPRPSGTLGHPLYFAITMLSLLPFAHYYLWAKKTWGAHVIYGVMLLLLTAALYETRSRVVLLAIFAWVVVILYKKFTLQRLMIAAAGIAILSTIVVSIPSVSRTYLRFPSILVRMNEWRFSGTYLLSRPIFGYGFETYDLYSVNRTREKGESEDGIADRLHALPLDTAWNVGIPGLVALALLWGTALCYGPRDRLGQATFLSGIAYGTSMLTMFDFSVTYLLFPTILALQTQPIENLSHVRIPKWGLAPIVIFCFLPSISSVLVSQCFEQAFTNNERSLAYCSTARKLSPWMSEFYMFERDALLRADASQKSEAEKLEERALKVGLPWYAQPADTEDVIY